MDERIQDRPGSLKSSIEVTLHTKEAVALFYGRKKTKEANEIVGINVFAEKVKNINGGSHNDDPYADYFLIEIESRFNQTRVELSDWQQELTQFSDKSSLNVNHGGSTKPIELETSFASVYANIALDLLKKADNLLLTLYALAHSGLLTRVEKNNRVNNINRLMRYTFLAADGYRFFSVNRKDVEQKTARYKQAHTAMKFTQELPDEILNKTLRAEHAPNIKLDPDEIFRKKSKPINPRIKEEEAKKEVKKPGENDE